MITKNTEELVDIDAETGLMKQAIFDERYRSSRIVRDGKRKFFTEGSILGKDFVQTYLDLTDVGIKIDYYPARSPHEKNAIKGAKDLISDTDPAQPGYHLLNHAAVMDGWDLLTIDRDSAKWARFNNPFLDRKTLAGRGSDHEYSIDFSLMDRTAKKVQYCTLRFAGTMWSMHVYEASNTGAALPANFTRIARLEHDPGLRDIVDSGMEILPEVAHFRRFDDWSQKVSWGISLRAIQTADYRELEDMIGSTLVIETIDAVKEQFFEKVRQDFDAQKDAFVFPDADVVAVGLLKSVMDKLDEHRSNLQASVRPVAA